MTKTTLIGALVVALALIGTGCDSSSTTLEAPTVTHAVTDNGGTLSLTWDAVSGAESYEITAGGSVQTTTSTGFEVTTPSATVEVRAVKGSSKSDPATIDCRIVESTVEFFGDLELTHANGFGFDSKGSAVACVLHAQAFDTIDFYAASMGGGMQLIDASAVTDRKHGNAVKAASGSYDGATIADPLGAYSDTLAVMADSTYYLRISADTTGTWSTNDNFAKVRVDSIVGEKVNLTTGYQKVEGLRWLVK